MKGEKAYGFQLRMFKKSEQCFLMRKTIFSTIQFYLTHICTQGHSAHIESIQWKCLERQTF